MRRYVSIAVALTVVIVIGFVAWRGLAMGGDLRDAGSPDRPLLLIPGFVAYAVALLASALLWRDVVTRLDGVRPPLRDSIAAFLASWPGRYVPSSVPYVAGKMLLGARLGHSTDALAGSVVYENVLMVAVALVGASIVLPVALAGEGAGLLVYLASGLGGLLALALLTPPVFDRLVRLAARLARRKLLVARGVLSYRGVLSGVGFAAIVTLAYAVSFALILSAFVDLSARELVISGGALALAGGVGVAALPVPSGLGVREAVLIGVMQIVVPIEAAAAAALLMRFGGLIVDLAFGAAGGALIAIASRRTADGPARLLDPA